MKSNNTYKRLVNIPTSHIAKSTLTNLIIVIIIIITISTRCSAIGRWQSNTSTCTYTPCFRKKTSTHIIGYKL